MISHQAVGMKRALRLSEHLPQVGQIDDVVNVLREAGVAVIAALDNMDSDVRNDKPRLPRHREDNGRRGAAVDELGL